VGETPVYKKLMMDELKVLEDTDHPNIPKVYALFEDKKNYYIITELVSGGNMLDKMMSMQKISETVTAKVIKQVLLCLNYMHKKMITHRDIKLENLLCMPQEKPTDDLIVKVTDFGFSRYFKQGEEMDLPLGSPLYMSPEIVCKTQYDQRVDTWAVGVLTYIMLTGTPPFYDEDKNRLNRKIVKSKVTFGPAFNKIS
jgi:calcium-dependent protein kinase